MSTTTDAPRRKRWPWFAGIAGVLVVALGVGVWYFVFRDDAPAAVSLSDAAESVRERDTVTSSGTSSSDGDDSLSGTWRIDTTIGSFSDFSNTFVGYRVQEELVNIGAKTAVGRTPDVSGSLTIDGTTITEVDIEVDMTTLVSDDSRRDRQMEDQGLETSEFPTASFALTTPIELGSVPAEGEAISVDAIGELTLHGVTKEVTFPLEATLQNRVVVVTGSLEVQFGDFEIGTPTSFTVLSVEDHGIIELQLFLTRS